MIKRRFYRQEHGERDGASSDSSSSSDPDLEAQSAHDSDAESQPQPDPEAASDVVAYKDDDDVDDDGHAPLRPQLPSSSSSGYESEDSSANEIDADSAGIPTVDDDSESGSEGERLSNNLALGNENGRIAQALAKDHPVTDDIPTCILRCKSVFKCRLCPKIVCLNMESLRAHLQSKRHARSEKLLNDGRLKRILNSDGEEEVLSDDDDGETHAERHARIVALAQGNPKKKSRGRQRQRQRLKRKKQKNVCEAPNSGQQMENRSKRRRKNVD